jgi:hypothetical protein
MSSIQSVTQLPTGQTSMPSVSGQVSVEIPRRGIRVAPVAAAIAILTNPISTQLAVSQFESKTTNASKVNRVVDIAKATNREDLRAIARIRIFRTYADGWNGPETLAPTSASIEEAELFARYLFGIGSIVAPYISASGDGEVNFYWKTRDWMIDLGFFGDGLYSYYVRFENGHEIIEDGTCLSQPLPQEIVELISKIS